MVLNGLLGQDRLAGCDTADHGHGDGAFELRVAPIEHLNGPGLRGIPADVPLLLQPGHVAVNGGTGAEADGLANLPHRRRVTLGADLILDELQDLTLALRQGFRHAATPPALRRAPLPSDLPQPDL